MGVRRPDPAAPAAGPAGAELVDAEDAWLEVGAADKARSVLELTEGRRIATVLDVGSGSGAVLQRLDACGFAERYFACEPSRPLYERLASKPIGRLAAAAPTTLEASPFADQSFDLVILSHVLEHVRDPARLLAAALARGRMVVAEVPIEANLAGDLRAFLRHARTGRPRSANAAGHVQFFSVADLRRLVGWCGGTVTRSRLYFPTSGYRHLASSARGAGRLRRELVLAGRALLGDPVIARAWYGHLAVLARPARPALSGRVHPLFWEPAPEPEDGAHGGT